MSNELDVITLRGLSAVGSHGVYEFERSGSQVFSADLKLYVDSRAAAQTDDVDLTVDYSRIAEDAVAVLTGPPVYLLETLANNLAEMAFSYPQVQVVEVTVHKPMAPVRHQFQDVSVTIRRTRDEEVPKLSQTETAQYGGLHARQHTQEPPRQVIEQRDEPRAFVPASSPAPKLRYRPISEANRAVTGPRSVVLGADNYVAPLDIPRSFTDGSPVYRAVLSLGSNRGKPLQNLSGAVQALRDTPGFEVLEISPVIRTLPVLEPNSLPQPDYYNAIVIGRTVLPPPVLLQTLQYIEHQFGRIRGRRWAARTLDIDIVDLDGMTLRTRDLQLPHPRAKERGFVLYPWFLVAPDDRLPGGGPIRDLLKVAPDRGGLRSVREEWLGEAGTVIPGRERPLNLGPLPSKPTIEDEGPKVVVRGEQLHLANVEGDPIFQTLLISEAERNRKIAAQRAAEEKKRQAEKKAARERAAAEAQRAAAAREQRERRAVADEIARQAEDERLRIARQQRREADQARRQAEQTQREIAAKAKAARQIAEQAERARIAEEAAAAGLIVTMPPTSPLPDAPRLKASSTAPRNNPGREALPDWRSAANRSQARVIDVGGGAPGSERLPESDSDAETSTQTAVQRRVTVRPSPTGSIPIIGRRGRRG